MAARSALARRGAPAESTSAPPTPFAPAARSSDSLPTAHFPLNIPSRAGPSSPLTKSAVDGPVHARRCHTNRSAAILVMPPFPHGDVSFHHETKNGVVRSAPSSPSLVACTSQVEADIEELTLSMVDSGTSDPNSPYFPYLPPSPMSPVSSKDDCSISRLPRRGGGVSTHSTADSKSLNYRWQAASLKLKFKIYHMRQRLQHRSQS